MHLATQPPTLQSTAAAAAAALHLTCPQCQITLAPGQPARVTELPTTNRSTPTLGAPIHHDAQLGLVSEALHTAHDVGVVERHEQLHTGGRVGGQGAGQVWLRLPEC